MSPFTGSCPLAYKSDICRTYWIEGENACPYGRLRCYFAHPAPSAHHTIARDTVASLEDPVAGVHLQRYQDLHNIQNLIYMQQAGVDVVASVASFSKPTIAQTLERVQAGTISSYPVLPLLNGSIVPMASMYPLQQFSDDCVSTVSLELCCIKLSCSSDIVQTSQGHFLRMPPPYSKADTTEQSILTSAISIQPSPNKEIASYLSREKAVKSVLAPANRLARENNPRRFSTVGPLGRNCASSGLQFDFKPKTRESQSVSGKAVKALKRPISRTLKQVQRSTLHEDSSEGTRLEANGRRSGSFQVADVINQVESRLSTRPF